MLAHVHSTPVYADLISWNVILIARLMHVVLTSTCAPMNLQIIHLPGGTRSHCLGADQTQLTALLETRLLS